MRMAWPNKSGFKKNKKYREPLIWRWPYPKENKIWQIKKSGIPDESEWFSSMRECDLALIGKNTVIHVSLLHTNCRTILVLYHPRCQTVNSSDIYVWNGNLKQARHSRRVPPAGQDMVTFHHHLIWSQLQWIPSDVVVLTSVVCRPV